MIKAIKLFFSSLFTKDERHIPSQLNEEYVQLQDILMEVEAPISEPRYFN